LSVIATIALPPRLDGGEDDVAPEDHIGIEARHDLGVAAEDDADRVLEHDEEAERGDEHDEAGALPALEGTIEDAIGDDARDRAGGDADRRRDRQRQVERDRGGPAGISRERIERPEGEMRDARRPEDEAEAEADKRVVAAVDDAVDEELSDEIHGSALAVEERCGLTPHPSAPLKGGGAC
jgi:hypothetical protein